MGASAATVQSLLFLGAFLSALVSLRVLSRGGEARSSRWLSLAMGASAAWSFLYALENLVSGLAPKILAASLQYLPIVLLPPAWHLFAAELAAEEGQGRRPRLRALLFALPAATFLLALLDPALGLLRRNFHLDETAGLLVLHKDFGPWFWLHSAYSYVLLALGTARLVRLAVARPGQDRGSAISLAVAAALPIAANLYYILPLGLPSLLDPTPLAFPLSGFLLLLGIGRFRLYGLVSAAASAAVERQRDPVLVLDRRGRLAYANEAARSLFGLGAPSLGLPLAGLSSELATLAPLVAGSERELCLGFEGEERCYELAVGFAGPEGRSSRQGGAPGRGLYLDFHDVTRRARAELDLRAANRGLEDAIADRTAELERANSRLLSELDQRRQTERQLFYFSLHDPLTGLPNRSLLMNRLDLAMARYRREPQRPYAILYVDFDGFKAVNDSFGHQAGDHFLKEAATRLAAAVREVDTVARLGGDEFVVLLAEVEGLEEAREVGERIAAELSVPLRYEGNVLVPSASVGILAADPSYAGPDEVLRDADIAMYQAKARGKNRRVLFESGMRAAVQERSQLRIELERAIRSRGISIKLQPIVDLPSGRFRGYETLARWTHPELGPVGPDRFIPLAEESGLILPLGSFVLREACRVAGAIKNSNACGGFFFTVNVSAHQLGDAEFADFVSDSLAASGLEPADLRLEITESALMENAEGVLPAIERVAALGVRFKLDDFGTGYSSLGYLHRFPIDAVKIDRSFVRDLGSAAPEARRRGTAEGIVRGIVSLGHELGLEVVAEGVETRAQEAALASCSCDFGQGYLYARPMEPAELLRLLSSCGEGGLVLGRGEPAAAGA